MLTHREHTPGFQVLGQAGHKAVSTRVEGRGSKDDGTTKSAMMWKQGVPKE
jgi:hypothetical protein